MPFVKLSTDLTDWRCCSFSIAILGSFLMYRAFHSMYHNRLGTLTKATTKFAEINSHIHIVWLMLDLNTVWQSYWKRTFVISITCAVVRCRAFELDFIRPSKFHVILKNSLNYHQIMQRCMLLNRNWFEHTIIHGNFVHMNANASSIMSISYGSTINTLKQTVCWNAFRIIHWRNVTVSIFRCCVCWICDLPKFSIAFFTLTILMSALTHTKNRLKWNRSLWHRENAVLHCSWKFILSQRRL